MPLTRRRNADVLSEMLALSGARVLDVGCGQGALARLMARQGARVTGIDVNPAQIAQARNEQDPSSAGEVSYLEGRAEALPFADERFHIVVFFNSLHHVPPAAMGQALEEASRVLCSDGVLYVSEPLAEGPHFELAKAIEDETSVRAAALAALNEACARGLLRQERELTYIHRVKLDDFDGFKARMTAVDPARKTRFSKLEVRLRETFKRLGEAREDGYLFDQPTRVNLLVKRAGRSRK